MQIIQSTSTSPTFNLATEEYFFSENQDDLLFLYVNEPSVIIGCNQAIQNEVNLDYCRENKIKVVRRMSGGGTVYHDLGNLNFCFISNKSNERSSLNPDFLNPIVEVLKALGIPVEVGKRKDLWLPDGFKISGTASHVGNKRELHHGTLLYDTTLDFLENALNSAQKNLSKKSIPSVKSPVKNLKDYLAEKGQFTLEANDFFLYFIQKLADLYSVQSNSTFSKEELVKIKLLEEIYISTEWVYKK